MTAFLLTTGIIILALGLVSYVSSKRDHPNDQSSALSLLPGDIKYEKSERQFPVLLSNYDVDRHQYHSLSRVLFLALMLVLNILAGGSRIVGAGNSLGVHCRDRQTNAQKGHDPLGFGIGIVAGLK